MIKVAPSLLSADFAHLAKEITAVEEAGADYLHLDIMDGIFVPNISFGFPVIKAILRSTKLPVDMHLMIATAGLYAPRFWELKHNPGSLITIHTKNCPNPLFIARTLRREGIKLGIAYNPEEESLPYLHELAPYIDKVLIMSVQPGFGSQNFIPGSEKRVAKARKVREELGFNFSIAVDGGINFETGKLVIEHGATDLVVGSFLFESENYRDVIEEFKSIGE